MDILTHMLFFLRKGMNKTKLGHRKFLKLIASLNKNAKQQFMFLCCFSCPKLAEYCLKEIEKNEFLPVSIIL